MKAAKDKRCRWADSKALNVILHVRGKRWIIIILGSCKGHINTWGACSTVENLLLQWNPPILPLVEPPNTAVSEFRR